MAALRRPSLLELGQLLTACQSRKQQQPKAWQGPNPITQRASSNTPNGTEKPLPKLPAQAPTAKSSCDLHADKHAHDRSIYLLSQFIVCPPQPIRFISQPWRTNSTTGQGRNHYSEEWRTIHGRVQRRIPRTQQATICHQDGAADEAAKPPAGQRRHRPSTRVYWGGS